MEVAMATEMLGQPVIVKDIHMPFGSMVRFMVKWAIASIPALFIVIAIGAIFWAVLAGFFIGLGK
jgi:hypothetical protein